MATEVDFNYVESRVGGIAAASAVVCLGVVVMSCIQRGSVAWILGGAIAILGLVGVVYESLREKSFWEISEHGLRTEKLTIDLDAIQGIERESLNESIFFRVELIDGSSVRLKAPYSPTKERLMWNSLQERFGRKGSGVDS